MAKRQQAKLGTGARRTVAKAEDKCGVDEAQLGATVKREVLSCGVAHASGGGQRSGETG